jgi:hypothetical protein
MKNRALPLILTLAPHSQRPPDMIDSSRRRSRRSRTEANDAAGRGVVDVSVPDVVLPDQYFSGEGLGLPDSPEKRLMFAVLLDAISQLRRRESTRAVEAEFWIRDEEDEGVFSFANVCGVLGFEPRSLAEGLLSKNSRIAGRAPLRHPRTSRLRVTPRRRGQREAVAVAG